MSKVCMFCDAGIKHAWCDDGVTFNTHPEPPPMQNNAHTIPVDEDNPTPLQILDKARALVYGDRQKDYGHPADDYGRTARLWSALLGVEITPVQAALCMVLVKLSREMNAPKADNLVDAHGYLMVAGRIKEREMGRE